MRRMFGEARVTNPETQLASFFAKYEPAIAKLGKALRDESIATGLYRSGGDPDASP